MWRVCFGCCVRCACCVSALRLGVACWACVRAVCCVLRALRVLCAVFVWAVWACGCAARAACVHARLLCVRVCVVWAVCVVRDVCGVRVVCVRVLACAVCCDRGQGGEEGRVREWGRAGGRWWRAVGAGPGGGRKRCLP